MNSFKLRLIFIIIGIVYILLVPAVLASDLDSSITDGIDMIEPISENEIIGVEYANMNLFSFEGIEMIQLRDLAEEYGWLLHFDSLKKEILIKGSDQTLELQVDDLESKLDLTYPLIRDGRTYLPISLVRDILREMGDEKIITGLYIDKAEYKPGEEVNVHIRLYNFTEESLRLNFGSGQKYDLYLLQDGEEIWRWSDGRFFTMALVQTELEADESLEYDLELGAELETGSYILSGELATIPERMALAEVSIWIVEE